MNAKNTYIIHKHGGEIKIKADRIVRSTEQSGVHLLYLNPETLVAIIPADEIVEIFKNDNI